MLETYILPAISFGLSATSLPGPMQAYIINTTLSYGWRKSIRIIFSPLIVDMPIIIVMVFLLDQMPDGMIEAIRVLGGSFLLYIAWGAWMQFRAGEIIGAGNHPTPDDEQKSSGRRIMLNALMMNVLSPGPYLFWGTITGPMLLQALGESPLHAIAFLIAFYGTFLGGLAFIVFVFNRLGQLDERFSRALILVVILLLVWFGTSLIAEAFGVVDLHRAVMLMLLLAVGLGWFLRNRRVQTATHP